jgi:hypothetical protein
LAFIQLPAFAVAYTRTSLRQLSANINKLVNLLSPVARDLWVKFRNSISYYELDHSLIEKVCQVQIRLNYRGEA